MLLTAHSVQTSETSTVCCVPVPDSLPNIQPPLKSFSSAKGCLPPQSMLTKEKERLENLHLPLGYKYILKAAFAAMPLHFGAKLKNAGDFKSIKQHHRLPEKGMVWAMASSIHERDGLVIGCCGCYREYKEPKWKLHFGPFRLVNFVPQKSSSISHSPQAK